MEDLVGKLLIYEIHLQEEQRETSDRALASKSIAKDLESQGDLDSKAFEGDIVMLVRGFHKMLTTKDFDLKKLQSGSSLKATKI